MGCDNCEGSGWVMDPDAVPCPRCSPGSPERLLRDYLDGSRSVPELAAKLAEWGRAAYELEEDARKRCSHLKANAFASEGRFCRLVATALMDVIAEEAGRQPKLRPWERRRPRGIVGRLGAALARFVLGEPRRLS